MLIISLVLALVALAALVTAVVTSNELVAWICIGASSLGVVMLIIDAIRDRKVRRLDALMAGAAATTTAAAVDLVLRETEPAADDGHGRESSDLESSDLEGVDLESVDIEEWEEIEDHPEEVVHDGPEFDTYSDDEAEFPAPAEESAVHIVVDDVDDESGDAESPDTEGVVCEPVSTSTIEHVDQAEELEAVEPDLPEGHDSDVDDVEHSEATLIADEEIGVVDDEHR